MSRVVVIGAGIAGLATAALLAREGHQVTVLEKNAEVGGRAGSWEHDGFRFDTGPSWYLMPEVFDHFYRLLGTSTEEQLNLVTLDPGYRLYGEGHADPIDIAANRADNLALFESIEPGSARRMERYLDRAAEVYEMAKRRFLYSTFVKLGPVFSGEVIRKGARLLRLLLEPLDRLARRTVKEPRLRQILGYPAVFLGGSPFDVPSMYSLMSHLDLDDGVLYPMGGFTRLIESIERLAVAEGVNIRRGVEVTRIRTAGRAVTGVDARLPSGRDGSFVADVVVAAADLHHVETTMLERAQQSYPASYWRTKTAGPSALLLYLGVRGELPELEHHTLLFAKDWRSNFGMIFGKTPRIPTTPSLYVCKPSGVDPSVAPEGHENVFVLVPIPPDPTLGRGGVSRDGDAVLEQLADRVIEQISDWAGIPDLAERIVVRRTIGPGDFVDTLNAWKGTALGPAHTLSQSAFFRARNASSHVNGLYYAGGSTIPGIGLPMCLISAELVVKRLRGDTSAGPLPEPSDGTGAARA